MHTNQEVRVRFAPSPTGGLHLGGVRTVLYNYLFARKHKGKFILRIEDTDQSRFVEAAEAYIFNCLEWAGLVPDESTIHGGNYGPYKQSERKTLYKPYVQQLIDAGQAYYAFDTPAELEQMRQEFKTTENPSPQYDKHTRISMKNSLSLTAAEVDALLAAQTPYVVRIKMPANETVVFNDMIRGEVKFDTNLIDDKVLLKADGMPTYHLAVVVDDYLMQITHAFRGEEWLPSSPVHVLLWQYLFGLENMPKWAHLPLILGPNGKLSKRDGAKYGFPVFAMNWTDNDGVLTEGFKEKGFLPEAFINLLALLGWNDGTEKEIYTINELIEGFSLDKVQSSGAKFDYEKAKWFNQEWIKRLPVTEYADDVKTLYHSNGVVVTDDVLFENVLELIKDRCQLLPDFLQQGSFFFKAPETYDTASIQPKWNEAKQQFFNHYCKQLEQQEVWEEATLEQEFKNLATEAQLKPGEVMMPLRIMLVGGKFGPAVFKIAELIGKMATIARIKACMALLDT